MGWDWTFLKLVKLEESVLQKKMAKILATETEIGL